MKRIILASGSPRRHELLDLIGIAHEVIPCKEEEKQIEQSKTLEEKLLEIAYQKVHCVEADLPEEKKSNSLIIGADTIVVFNHEIIGKPKTNDEAVSMLSKILGHVHEVYTGLHVHEVYTGLCILDTDTKKILSRVEKTLVSMKELPEEKIIAYVEAENVLDKAGGYAIQGIGAGLIDRIEGCFYNVMGLPLHRITTMLEKLDYIYIEAGQSNRNKTK
ncbi:MAG: Maf family protein [Candidatus Heimdallarchaeota archaeon]